MHTRDYTHVHVHTRMFTHVGVSVKCEFSKTNWEQMTVELSLNPCERLLPFSASVSLPVWERALTVGPTQEQPAEWGRRSDLR